MAENGKKGAPGPSGARKRKRLGDLLVEAGVITPDQLMEALKQQKTEKKRIGQLLIDMGFTDEVEIAKALSVQLKIPFVELRGKQIPQAVVDIVPVEMAENYLLMPLKEDGQRLVVAMANPLEFYALDDLRFVTQRRIQIAVCTESDVLEALERHYPKPGLEEKFGKPDEAPEDGIEIVKQVEDDTKDLNRLLSIAELPPVVRFTNSIFADAIKLKASDIHIEPQKASVVIRYRVDGIMREIMQTDKHVHASLVSRVKVLANMDISVRRRPQDGRAQVRYHGKNYDMRVSSIPTSYGEKLTIRILNPDAGNMPLEELGFQKEILDQVKNALSRPNGIVIVTGPTGSGKSSTLYSCLNRLNAPEVNIVTVEDPVEFDVDGINQVQINPKAGITFAEGLRSILRQDPDIVMVGEIRDSETATIAGQAAQTGHLVLTTLHTNDAPSAVIRLMDLGVEPFILAESLVVIIAQRLVRRVCRQCRAPNPLSPRILQQLPPGLAGQKDVTFYKGEGCESCRFSGYDGRMGIFEVLTKTPAIQDLIATGAGMSAIKRAALAEGFHSLFLDGLSKALAGETTIEEVFRVAPPTGDESGQIPFQEEEAGNVAAEAESAHGADTVVAVQNIKPRKILVVDDDAVMLEMITHVLKSENYLTITATNGLEALKLAAAEVPDLIISDYMMPEMDGLTLLRRLKTELSTRLIPVMILSAREEVENEVAVLEAGAEDFLAKPINARRLAVRVRRAIEG